MNAVTDVDSAAYHAAEAIEIPLGRLTIDEHYQPRLDGVDRKHLASLMVSNPDDWPALTVSPDGDTYVVIDGAHRLEAGRKLGLKTVRCVVQSNAGYPDAFAANLAHGLPLSVSDRKAFATYLHEEQPGLSNREIGRQTGLSHHTVAAAIAAKDSEGTGKDAQPAWHSPKQNPVVKMIDLLAKASTEGIGRGFFGTDTSVKVIRAAIDGYEDDYRPELARSVAGWGKACIEAAKNYGAR